MLLLGLLFFLPTSWISKRALCNLQGSAWAAYDSHNTYMYTYGAIVFVFIIADSYTVRGWS